MSEAKSRATNMLLVLTIAGMLLSGCASTPPHSGFLTNYPAMQTDPADESMMWWEKPGIDWSRYTKLMIDPVIVYFHPESKNQGIDPETLKELTDYFRKTVVEHVQDLYPVVEKPAADVLRIRAAITDIIPANPWVNAVTVAGAGLPLDMGGAAMEAEFLDSVTGESLGAVIDERRGAPVDVGDMIDGFTTWGHAKSALDDWAELLRESLRQP